MFTRMTSGGGGISDFTITKVWCYDGTGNYTQSIPSDTDFLIVLSLGLNLSPNRTSVGTFSPSASLIGMIFNKGDTLNLENYQTISSYGTITSTANHQTITWNSDNTISQTRQSTGGRIYIFACKYTT